MATKTKQGRRRNRPRRTVRAIARQVTGPGDVPPPAPADRPAGQTEDDSGFTVAMIGSFEVGFFSAELLGIDLLGADATLAGGTEAANTDAAVLRLKVEAARCEVARLLKEMEASDE